MKTNYKFLVWGVLIVLSLALIGSIFFFAQQTVFAGFTVQSISATKIFQNEEDVQTGFFLVSISATGTGESLIGRIDEADFANYGFDVEKGFEISMSAIDEQLNYPIQRVYSQNVKELKLIHVERPSLFTAPVCPNPSKTIFELTEYILGVKTDKWCVEEDVVAVVGDINNPSITYDAEISVHIDGKIYQRAIIGSGDDSPRSVALGNIGSAEWVGSFITGNSWPSPHLYKAIYFVGEDKWRIVDEGDWDDYKNSYDISLQNLQKQMVVLGAIEDSSFIYKLISDIDINDDILLASLNADINPVNNKVSNLRSQNVVLFSGQSTSGGDSGGSLTIPSETRLTFPSITFRLKASEIGVKLSSGVPSITNVDCPDFESGQRGEASVSVKNIGSNTGTFDALLSNCDFRVVSNVNSVRLSPGESGTIPILIDADTFSDVRDTCDIVVYDVKNPVNKDTSSVTCKATKPEVCVDGVQYLNGVCVDNCVNGVLVRDFCCDDRITVDANGVYECSEELPVPDTCKIAGVPAPDFFCEKGIGLQEILAVLFGLVMMVFSSVALSNLAKKQKWKVNNFVLYISAFLIGIISMVLIAVLIYVVWVIIALIALYITGKMFVGGKK